MEDFKIYNNATIETHYFPSIEYFVLLNNYKKINLENFEYYRKQTYRNRCLILTSQGIQKLIVPVHQLSSKQIIKDTKISYDTNWQKLHWKSIQTSYNKSAFFQYYSEDFKNIIFKKHIYIFDLNLALISKCFEIIGIKKVINLTDSYLEKNEYLEKKIKDLRNLIINKQDFHNRNIYKPKNYVQTFQNLKNFIPNLSIIDLIFCQGPLSNSFLESSSLI